MRQRSCKRVTNPTEDSKKYFIRVYIKHKYSNYPEDNSIKVIINRSQYCNLIQLDPSVTEILYLAQVSCAVELWNNFLKETSISLIKITNSKYSLKKKYLNKFVNNLKKHVSNSNNLSTSEVIPEEIKNNSKNKITQFRVLLEYRYLIRSRYRNLQYNSRNNTLFCKLSNNEVVSFIHPTELISLRVKDSTNNIYMVESIDLTDDVWDITLSEI